MMTAGDTDRAARERQDADRRYNDALTALDRAIVDASQSSTLDRADLSRVTTALIVFLQQITLFVESKDREIVASVEARQAATDASLEQLDEIRTQMRVVQRAVQALTRSAGAAEALASTRAAAAAAPAPATSDFKYVAFEDAFRGPEQSVADRLQTYVPIFKDARDVVDLGCGRGELLAAFRGAGIRARGVDASADMTAIARERGLDAVHGDALAFLEGQPDDSLGGVIATQVIEHLEPPYLMRLLETASHKLRLGAPIVLETINAACWLAFFSSYLRDLPRAPVHGHPPVLASRQRLRAGRGALQRAGARSCEDEDVRRAAGCGRSR
jgi:O-antigen chain-terminating methyltransferase